MSKPIENSKPENTNIKKLSSNRGSISYWTPIRPTNV